MDRTEKIPVQEQKKIQKRAKKNAKPKMKKQMKMIAVVMSVISIVLAAVLGFMLWNLNMLPASTSSIKPAVLFTCRMDMAIIDAENTCLLGKE